MEDRYAELVSIKEHPKYKDTYIINEIDEKKGIRISQVNSKFDANIRTDKCSLGELRPRPKYLVGEGMALRRI